MVPAKVARRVNGEAVVLLGWGRAILLQLAHPLVAAGVAEHSGFGGGPLNYVRRTHRTVGAMLALTFGSPEEMRDRANRINAIHRRVHGVLREPTRHFAVGTPYSATDPDLLRWVHATIVESQLRAYELFVGPLTDDERDQYCAKAAEVAPLLSIPRDFLPTDAGALDRYLDAMYRSPAIEVTASARRLGRALPISTGRQNDRAGHGDRPSGDNRLLPADIRAAYGFSWDDRRQRKFRRLATATRRVRRVLPPVLREWPAARRGPTALPAT